MKFLLIFLALLSMVTVSDAQKSLSELEAKYGGQLGVWAIDTETGQGWGIHEKSRFPLCSTFKVMAAAAILEQSNEQPVLLGKSIHFTREDLVTYSPITEKHLEQGMSLRELCAAAIQYSDNTAGNLLIRQLGGPEAVTAFARSIGNDSFRLDRWETELNAAIPDDPRDTVTPADMAKSLRLLALEDRLSEPNRKQLNEWLIGNTTGAKRVRAAVPKGWIVGDKTGSGSYGAANDIAIVWPPDRKPIVIAVYYRQKSKDAEWNNEVIASATELVLRHFLDSPKSGEK